MRWKLQTMSIPSIPLSLHICICLPPLTWPTSTSHTQEERGTYCAFLVVFTATGVPLPANGPRTVSVLSVEPWRFLSALPASTLPLPALSLLLRSVMLARAGSLDYRMAPMERMRVGVEYARNWTARVCYATSSVLLLSFGWGSEVEGGGVELRSCGEG